MNIWLLLGGTAGALFLLKKKSYSPPVPIAAPWRPEGPPGLNISDPGGNSRDISSVAGKAISTKTGNPIFGKVGEKIGQLFAAFHPGSEESNDLVQRYQNPLGAYLAEISAAWNVELAGGRATSQLREDVKQLMRNAAAEFYAICAYYPNKGPGGTATIKHVVEDILIADMDRLHL